MMEDGWWDKVCRHRGGVRPVVRCDLVVVFTIKFVNFILHFFCKFIFTIRL